MVAVTWRQRATAKPNSAKKPTTTYCRRAGVVTGEKKGTETPGERKNNKYRNFNFCIKKAATLSRLFLLKQFKRYF